MVNLKQHYFCFIITCLAFLVNSSAFAFDTKAKQAYLLDYNTKVVLFDKNGKEKMCPSSMTKLMTVYIVFDNLKKGYMKLHDSFPVSENAWKTGGTKMFVALNSNVSIEDLIRGIIVQSGNDASKVLAEGMYGDENAFAEYMNHYAKKLGMHSTQFKNASGLPHNHHYSSAQDITTLSASLIKDFPEYYHYFSEKEFTHSQIRQFNKNTLLGKNGVDGLKTGHTNNGGYGIVVSAERNGRRLIAVVNGLDSENQRIVEADKLLNYGFNNFKNIKIAANGEVFATTDVWYGSKDQVNLVSTCDIEVTIPKNLLKKETQTIKVIYKSPVVAPIKQGQELGKLVIFENGQEIFSENLVAQENISEANFIEKAIQNMQYYYHKLLNFS